ncbi:hypothetical protein DWB85_11810 [Seongchinamella sediminis]|uniref:Uncharacterized protein n=1 Tax=Seongchinamella sediminis TaxID=2283635 RepID=A0A3L7E0E9_9GAMM|nr:hypothetical protein DWB85_11810 [Seongchinamella sediminis]
MAVPPEWWAESEEESILIGDHDGVGCIEISTLHKEQGEFSREEVAQIARDEAEHALQWESLSLGDFRGVRSSYQQEGVAIREWYVANGPMLLFITYSCEDENRGMDDAAVDEILDTLMLS